MAGPIGAPRITNPTGQVYTDPGGNQWVSVKGKWFPSGYSGGSHFLRNVLPTSGAARPVFKGINDWQATHPAYNKHIADAIMLFGAGAGLYSGLAGAGGVGAGSASTIDPFLAGGGAGAWAPYAGGAGTIAGGGGIAGAGAGAGGVGAGGAAGMPWYNSFWGQTGINTGLNLIGGYMQNRAIQKAQNQSRKDIEDRIRRALEALSPEHIAALAQQFLPQMAANASQSGQTAIQAVREQAARTGQLESPRALSFEAGTRAKLASDVQRQAFEGAFNTAGNQASAITGAPYTPITPQLGYADAILNSANQAYFTRALQQRPPQPTQGVPYRWPGSGGLPQGRYY